MDFHIDFWDGHIRTQVWTHKSAEAAVSATHASKSKNVPENRHPDGGHPQSVDSTTELTDRTQ